MDGRHAVALSIDSVGVGSVLWFDCMLYLSSRCFFLLLFFFFQAEDGIRDLVRSRGLGDVYKRQKPNLPGNGLGRLSP